MTTPSGQISAQDIKNEFGEVGGTVPLGSYRVSQTKGALTLAIGDGIPTSGTISYNQMRNKRLNIVVDYYADNANLNRTDNGDNTMNAQNRYENQNERVHVIGGLRSKPSNTAPHRVRIHVNQTLGGKKGDGVVALRTGNWNSGTDLIVDVGSNGKIYGGGGDGGEGGNTDDAGNAGQPGASGLGVDYNGTTVNVASGGLISCGFGGGGGGGSGQQSDKGSNRRAGGGGGGGGQGYPAGSGGHRGVGNGGDAGDGSAGDLTEAGEGGGGANNDGQAYGAGGGEGGSVGQAADAGGGAQHAGGAGGGEGAGIRRTSGHTVHINNSGTIHGVTNATGVY